MYTIKTSIRTKMARPSQQFSKEQLRQIAEAIHQLDVAFPHDNGIFLDEVIDAVRQITRRVYGARRYANWLADAGVGRRPSNTTLQKAVDRARGRGRAVRTFWRRPSSRGRFLGRPQKRVRISSGLPVRRWIGSLPVPSVSVRRGRVRNGWRPASVPTLPNARSNMKWRATGNCRRPWSIWSAGWARRWSPDRSRRPV